MLNKRTLLEVIHTIENWTTAELDRFALIFNITIPDQINGQALSKAKKANMLVGIIISHIYYKKKAIRFMLMTIVLMVKLQK